MGKIGLGRVTGAWLVTFSDHTEERVEQCLNSDKK